MDHRTPQDAALLALLGALRRRDYSFVTPTPATHRRVLARPDKRVARDLPDVLGWSLPFEREVLDDELWDLLAQSGEVEPAEGGRFRATIRVSGLGGDLYLHSAYPTVQEDAVFFGPDSYRFAALVASELSRMERRKIATALDIGTGAGVGAIVLKRLCPAARVVGTDVNGGALRFAALNAAAAGVTIEALEADTPSAVGSPLDLAIANPPYIIDAGSRTYRDGGALHGRQVSVDMVADALPQLSADGRMILYTGSAIVAGRDSLHEPLLELAAKHRRSLRYSMIDPDVFGEELEKEAYRDVERIALVAAVFEPPSPTARNEFPLRSL